MKKVLLSLAIIIALGAEAQVKKVYDKYEGETTWSISPTPNVTFYKRLQDGNTEPRYQLCFSTTSSYLTGSASDVVLLFEDGWKTAIDGEVDPSYYGGGKYSYTAYVFSGDFYTKIIANKKLVGYKIHVFDPKNMNKAQQIAIQNAAKQLLVAK